MQISILITCDNIQEANLIKGRLENEGIYSIVTNENFTTLMPHFNGMLGAGVQVLVNETDYENAVEILQLDKKIDGEVICPNCNSKNTRFGLGVKKRNKIVAIILSLFSGVPFGNIRNTFYCLDCKTDFKV